MFYSTERHALRQKFFDVHKKIVENQPLNSIEATIWAVIQAHPEYLFVFDNKARYLNKDFSVEMGETNPFLHMSSHIGLHDQISTNRPKGITTLYQSVIKAGKLSAHDIEHEMIDVMMEMLWQSQRSQTEPDEKLYLKKLKKLLKKYG